MQIGTQCSQLPLARSAASDVEARLVSCAGNSDLGAAPDLSRVSGSDGSERPPGSAGARGFDFLLGRWNVRHRKLGRRLVGCTEWIEFSGTLEVFRVLGGLGNIDDNDLDDPEGQYRATSLRLFDTIADQWAIRWIDGRSAGIDPPLIGTFLGREGRFHGDDFFAGRAIRIRFVYEDVKPGLARWEQAFSIDQGITWETNWTMEFIRVV